MFETYDFFISFAGTEREVAERLYSRLRMAYEHFERRIFFAPQSIGLGERWAREFVYALRNSRVIVVLVTKGSESASYQQGEVIAALELVRADESRRVIPIAFEKSPFVWDVLAPFQGFLIRAASADADLDDVANRLLAEFRTLRAIREALPPRGHGWSETNVLRSVAASALAVLESVGPPVLEGNQLAAVHAGGLLAQIEEVLRENPNYKSLRSFCDSLAEHLRGGSVPDVAAWIYSEIGAIHRHTAMLGRIGAEVISPNDAILLYSFSSAVLASIEEWFRLHEEDFLTFYLCECRPKSASKPFAEAMQWAERLPRDRCRVKLIADADVARRLCRGDIRKVFLGAHILSRPAARRASFDNTSGSLAIVQAAASVGVPLFVFARSAKGTDAAISRSGGYEHAPRVSELRLAPRDRRNLSQRHPGAFVHAPEPDTISSADYPFFLITENGREYCCDFTLQKSNEIAIEERTRIALKRTVVWEEAAAERRVLVALGSIGAFNVPTVAGDYGNEAGPWASVEMRAIRGVRVHDLLLTLRALISDPASSTVADVAGSLRDMLLQTSLAAVQQWQSDTIQSVLRDALGDLIRPYPFASKFKEVVDALARHRPSLSIADAAADVDEVAERLSTAGLIDGVLLRDATLKNQIFELHGGVEREVNKGLRFCRPADVQWRDLELATRLLQSMTGGEIPLLSKRIWQVDFESASQLTNRADDYVHVLCLAVVGWSVDEIVAEISRRTGQSPEVVLLTVLFRGVRGWARRVSYLLERPDLYSTRYRYERLEHPLNLARAALNRLRSTCGGLERLGRWLDRCDYWQSSELERRAAVQTRF